MKNASIEDVRSDDACRQVLLLDVSQAGELAVLLDGLDTNETGLFKLLTCRQTLTFQVENANQLYSELVPLGRARCELIDLYLHGLCVIHCWALIGLRHVGGSGS